MLMLALQAWSDAWTSALLSAGQSAADFQNLSSDVIGFRNTEEHDTAGGFIGGASAAEGCALLNRLDHRASEPDTSGHVVDRYDRFSTYFLRQARLDIAE